MFPRLGFLGGIISLLAGPALGLSSHKLELLPNGDETHMSGLLVGRSGGGRTYTSSPGERAHRLWRKARASGRHDFRRTLKRKAA